MPCVIVRAVFNEGQVSTKSTARFSHANSRHGTAPSRSSPTRRSDIVLAVHRDIIHIGLLARCASSPHKHYPWVILNTVVVEK